MIQPQEFLQACGLSRDRYLRGCRLGQEHREMHRYLGNSGRLGCLSLEQTPSKVAVGMEVGPAGEGGQWRGMETLCSCVERQHL